MIPLYILIVITILFIATLPLLFGRNKKENVIFSLSAYSITFWIISNFWIYNSSYFLFWNRMAYLGGTLLAGFLLYFMMIFPKKIYSKKHIPTIIFLPVVILSLLSPTPFIVKSMNGIENVEFGIGNTIFSIYFVSYIILMFSISIKGILKYSGIEKKQLSVYFYSLFFSMSTATATNLVVPTFGISEYMNLGPIFASVYIFSMSYSLLKNQMFDIKMFISKVSASIFTCIFFGGGLAFIYWLKDILNITNIISTPVILFYVFTSGVNFQKLRIRLQQTTEKLFLKGQYDYKKALIKFTAELSECTDLDNLNATIQKNFEDEIEISNIDIFLPEGFTERKEIASKLVLQDQKKLVQQEDNRKLESKLKTITREDIEVNTLSESDTLYQTLVSRNEPIAFIKEKNKDLTTLFTQDKKHAIVPCFNTDHKLLCVLTLGEKMTQDEYSDDDIDLLTTLAAQIPPVLERIHQARVSAEMDVAQRIQVEIIPKDPEIKGLDLSCYMSPADEVGGDYYDVYEMEKSSWLVVGDVAGHGVGSGLVMFMVQSIMATLLQSQPDITPGELNYQANQILCKNFERLDEDRPMTLVTLQTIDSRTFSISGSHDNIYIYRHATKEIEAISVDHFPFGIGLTGELERELFMEETFTIETGDLLFLGTDGITEAFKDGNDKAEQYGEHRLTDIISKHHSEPVNDIRKALLEDLDTFSQGIYYDDVTFIIAKAV